MLLQPLLAWAVPEVHTLLEPNSELVVTEFNHNLISEINIFSILHTMRPIPPTKSPV